MATLTGATGAYDLVSWAKARGPDFKVQAHIAELLNQSNEMIPYIPWFEANMPTSHLITQRIGLPTTYTRQLNSPVQTSRGQTAQVTEAISLFEAWAEMDEKMLGLWADAGAFLYLQNLGFYESITQKFAQSFIYGDPSVDPTQFLGLAPRYSTVNTANAANAQNVVDAGGTASVNTSIWLVTLSPQALHGIFPKGSPAGINHFVNDNQVIQGTTTVGGTRLRVHQEQWTWDAGIALWDWRYCARLANIDTTNLKNQAGAADLTEGMIDLTYRLPTISFPASATGNPTSSLVIQGKTVFLCNRTVRAALHKQALNKANNSLSIDTFDGRKILNLMGIPILNCDQILNSEAQVV